MRYQDEAFARQWSKTMTRHTPDAILEAVENVRAAECMLVPATAHYHEVDRLVPLFK